MDKELLHKRIKVLNEIEMLKIKCDCFKFNNKCSNCLKISSLGKHLLTLLDKREEIVEVKVEKKEENVEKNAVQRLESLLTVDRYHYYKESRLTEKEIAQIYKVHPKAIMLFRKKYGIKVKVVNHRTSKELEKVEKIIKREEKRIYKKVASS